MSPAANAEWVRLWEARHPGTIYAIVHRDTGRTYIGCTTKSVERRWQAHRSAAKKPQFPIQAAINEFGPDAFDVEVIAVVPYRERFEREKAEIVARGTYWPDGFNVPVRSWKAVLEAQGENP